VNSFKIRVLQPITSTRHHVDIVADDNEVDGSRSIALLIAW